LDVRHEFPDLVSRQLRAPGRHAVRAAFRNRAENLGVLRSVQPIDVAQARPHASTCPAAMAPRAVEANEERAALGARIAIVLVRILRTGLTLVGAGNRTNSGKDVGRRGLGLRVGVSAPAGRQANQQRSDTY